MNERGLIEIIKSITKSRFIGDDCAYLKELGITVTQDSFVEGVHFSFDWMTPYQLGAKAIKVNISDILASGAEPVYCLVALSLPGNLGEGFVEEFYRGMQAGAASTVIDGIKPVEIAGGDLTGGDKVFISISMIGKAGKRNISSRRNAKPGYKIVVCGQHGASAGGLRLLEQGRQDINELVQAHFNPTLYPKFALTISDNIQTPYAMMDTSDGLGDALFKIAVASGVTICIDFEKIPYNKKIEIFSDWKNLVLFGGEDYGLVAALPEDYCGTADGIVVGEVLEGGTPPLIVNYSGSIVKYNSVDEFTFNHFLH